MNHDTTQDRMDEATRAWNSTVSGILAAAKAVHEVREAIGGKGSGSFSKWAVEELRGSQPTASCLADLSGAERHTLRTPPLTSRRSRPIS